MAGEEVVDCGGGEMKTICAWCAKKGITTILSDDKAPATMQILDGSPGAPVSHGICEPCYRELFGDGGPKEETDAVK
jgi:hypothetical protein